MGSHEDLTEFEQEQYYGNDACLKSTSDASHVHQESEYNQFDHLQNNEPKMDPYLDSETENCATEVDFVSVDKNENDESKDNEDLVELRASGFITESTPNCEVFDVHTEHLSPEEYLNDAEQNPSEAQNHSECDEPQLTEEVISQEYEDEVREEGNFACSVSKPDLFPNAEVIFKFKNVFY